MDDLRVGDLIIPAADLEERFETSGGPGGQHANRTQSAVRLRFNVAEASLDIVVKERLRAELGDVVEVVATESRSQFRNRALARKRMRDRIESALSNRAERRETRPTRSSRTRRLDEKRARSETKRLRRRPDLDD